MANDNNEVKGPKTKPLRKTSAVPLRKETVRVTLKATPAGASGAPRPPAPAPPKPPSVATTPLETSPIDEAPAKPAASVDLPDVTSAVPLRQETMRVTLKADTSGAPIAPAASPAASTPAPTVPLGGGPSSPQPATPAPTIPLGGSPAGNATVPLATQPIGGGSQPLPKATVQLQQTQQLTQPVGGPTQMPTIHAIAEEEPVKGEGINKILSIVAFAAALVAFLVTFMNAQKWTDEHHPGKLADQLMSTEKVSFPKKTKASQYNLSAEYK